MIRKYESLGSCHLMSRDIMIPFSITLTVTYLYHYFYLSDKMLLKALRQFFDNYKLKATRET